VNLVPQPDAVDGSVVDFGVLSSWMDEQGLPGGPFADVAPLSGGTQNVMLSFRRGGRSYVLRRPPVHLRRKSNDALVREMRVLAALADTPVPAPAYIAGCADPAPLGGAVFYLMELVDGFNPSVALPSPHRDDPAVRHAMGLNAAAAIAALGAVDHAAVGLGDIGHPDGFLERQVRRWLSELETYAELPGYPGPDIPGVDRVADWLERNRPTAWRPGLMHGDFHMANIMFRHDGPEVAAIIDWEMTTVGDPLLDLGWMLATRPDPDDGTIARTSPLAAAGGFPSRTELVRAYGAASDRDLSSATWYEVLACFKLGIVLEGSNARAAAGKAPREIGDRLHAHTLNLFDRALSLI
jgi:aminoglycoside phosphotransferase (APT) family kinase protein